LDADDGGVRRLHSHRHDDCVARISGNVADTEFHV
jgi:hypothetical protein